MKFRLVQWATIVVVAVTSVGTLPGQTPAQDLQQQMLVLGSPTVTVNTAAGAVVNAECSQFVRRIPGRDKDGKLLQNPDTFAAVSGQDPDAPLQQPTVEFDNRSIPLQQAIREGRLVVQGTGAFSSIRILRANPNDNTTYTIRFNGPAVLAPNGADIDAAARNRLAAFQRLTELVANRNFTRLQVQQMYWECVQNRGVTDAASMERVIAQLLNKQ